MIYIIFTSSLSVLNTKLLLFKYATYVIESLTLPVIDRQFFCLKGCNLTKTRRQNLIGGRAFVVHKEDERQKLDTSAATEAQLKPSRYPNPHQWDRGSGPRRGSARSPWFTPPTQQPNTQKSQAHSPDFTNPIVFLEPTQSLA